MGNYFFVIIKPSILLVYLHLHCAESKGRNSRGAPLGKLNRVKYDAETWTKSPHHANTIELNSPASQSINSLALLK